MSNVFERWEVVFRTVNHAVLIGVVLIVWSRDGNSPPSNIVDDQGVAEVLNQMVTNKVGVRSFGEKDPTLEDVFMMVTKGLVS